jgi:hypothetical protein
MAALSHTSTSRILLAQDGLAGIACGRRPDSSAPVFSSTLASSCRSAWMQAVAPGDETAVVVLCAAGGFGPLFEPVAANRGQG